jgi:trans-2-enoyl-CoA reductase
LFLLTTAKRSKSLNNFNLYFLEQYVKEMKDLKMKLQQFEHENIIINQDVNLKLKFENN